MTVAQLIDEVLTILNAGGAAVDDSALRRRVFIAVQRVVDKAWTFRPMSRRYATSTVRVLQSDDGIEVVPADFASAGNKLRVYVQGQRREITYRDPSAVMDLRERNTDTAQWPDFYTFAGQDVSGALQIIFYRRPSQNFTAVLENYIPKPPQLFDRPDACTPAPGVGTGLTGNYKYKVAFYSDLYGFGPAGPESPIVTLADGSADLSDIALSPSPLVTKRALYRTKANGDAFYFLDFIGDNETTTYSDSTLDTGLGPTLISTPGADGLQLLPESHHRTAIMEAVLEIMARNEGDSRSATEWPPLVLTAFAQMWAEESIHHVVKRPPAYGARAYSRY